MCVCLCVSCLSCAYLCVWGRPVLTFPTRSFLPTGAHQAGWVNGVSWKTPAIPAPVLAMVSARARWWQAPPGSPAAAPVASEAQTAPCQTPASAAPVPMVPAAPWGPMAATSAPAHLATRAAAAEATWMSAGWADPAAMVAPVSTHLAPSAASAQLATQGHCVRAPWWPVPPRRAVTGAPVDRVATSPMTVPAFLGSRARTVK